MAANLARCPSLLMQRQLYFSKKERVLGCITNPGDLGTGFHSSNNTETFPSRNSLGVRLSARGRSRGEIERLVVASIKLINQSEINWRRRREKCGMLLFEEDRALLMKPLTSVRYLPVQV